MRRLVAPLAGSLFLLGACRDVPPEVTDASTGASGSSGTGSTTTGSTTTDDASTVAVDETGIGTGSATGGSSGGTSGSSTDGDSSSSDESTGGVSSVGCADGEREALVDEMLYPDIAACAGGFAVPGVGANMPTCGRSGGDDGALPDGMSCSIDDLCAEGWHVCISQGEVSERGIDDCGLETWSSAFYATAQSGNGFDTCGPVGTNDVFGCGDIGLTKIHGCDPLNRSTGNGCGVLIGPWDCPALDDEVGTLVKTGEENGGALCCRDAP